MPEIDTKILPLLPLTTGVVLPGMVVTLTLESDEAKRAVAAARATDGQLLLVPRLGSSYSRIGTVATVEDVGILPSGLDALVIRGTGRARVGLGVPGTGDATWVQVEDASDEGADTSRARELAREYRATIEGIVEARGVGGVADFLRGISDPGAMADTSGYSPDLEFEQKIQVLETVDVEARLELVLAWARDVLADLSLKDRIRSDVAEGMEKTQREFLLRQQLAAIRKELGDDGGGDDAVEEYRRKAAAPGVPDKVREAIEREVERLERTSEQNPEHGWIRTWLDTITELPWGSRSDDALDLVEARRVLDADHNGLDDVKDRIVEYLAVRKRRADRGLEPAGGRGSGAIVALVGPPGVGKTSLGESVARALGRSFARVSLGGIRGEAEVRGHCRTYVGAMPGRIVRALKEAGTMNPVVMLDEVDKLGADWRGDPSAALLEVLDPEQNHAFSDHYLGVPFDLSEVMFITTANLIDPILSALRDRMEIIEIPGYSEEEKLGIAKRFLIPRQLTEHGLTEKQITFTDRALHRIISDYTREAGVRNLEREIANVMRKVVKKIAEGDDRLYTITPASIPMSLGVPKHHSESDEKKGLAAVATGWAWPESGGDVMHIEATIVKGKGALTLTGHLGDVTKESAQAALSYVRSRDRQLGIKA